MRSRWTAGGDSCTMIYQNCGDACGERKPEKEKPVQAKEVSGWKTRRISQRRDAERTRVGKRVSRLPRKAAIVSYEPVPKTDTGG